VALVVIHQNYYFVFVEMNIVDYFADIDYFVSIDYFADIDCLVDIADYFVDIDCFVEYFVDTDCLVDIVDCFADNASVDIVESDYFAYLADNVHSVETGYWFDTVDSSAEFDCFDMETALNWNKKTVLDYSAFDSYNYYYCYYCYNYYYCYYCYNYYYNNYYCYYCYNRWIAGLFGSVVDIASYSAVIVIVFVVDDSYHMDSS
jgi:hypothetical protein